MTARTKGAAIGFVVGLLAAWQNWDGRALVALSSVLFAGGAGYLIGLLLEKFRK